MHFQQDYAKILNTKSYEDNHKIIKELNKYHFIYFKSHLISKFS